MDFVENFNIFVCKFAFPPTDFVALFNIFVRKNAIRQRAAVSAFILLPRCLGPGASVIGDFFRFGKRRSFGSRPGSLCAVVRRHLFRFCRSVQGSRPSSRGSSDSKHPGLRCSAFLDEPFSRPRKSNSTAASQRYRIENPNL